MAKRDKMSNFMERVWCGDLTFNTPKSHVYLMLMLKPSLAPMKESVAAKKRSGT